MAEDQLRHLPGGRERPSAGLCRGIIRRARRAVHRLSRQILRGCNRAGIHAESVELQGEATEARSPRRSGRHADPAVDGLIVQMPPRPTIRLRTVNSNAIDPAKDIDGIHPYSTLGTSRLGL